MKKSAAHITEEINTILTAISNPLAYAARNDFATLHTLKDVHTLVCTLADKGLRCSTDQKCRLFFTQAKRNFKAFGSADHDCRKKIITKTLTGIQTLRASPANRNADVSFTRQHEGSINLAGIPIRSVRGVGPRLAEAFGRIHIDTVEDLLYLLPRTYADKRSITSISQLEPGMHATVIGTVTRVGKPSFAGRRRVLEIQISDGSRTLALKWFNISGAYLNLIRTTFTVNREVIVSGTVSSFRFSHEMHHPEIELHTDGSDLDRVLTISPLYPLTEGIHQKTLQRIIKGAVDTYVPMITDWLPAQIRDSHDLVPLQEAFQKVHLPDNTADINRLLQSSSPWHRRIVFDEFFQLQVVLALKKRGVSLEKGTAFSVPGAELSAAVSSLPFTLTGAQQRCLDEILEDMQQPFPMNRLIQGDVGSGKTVVALLACLVTFWNGYQSALMAPTELLAEQHFKTIGALTETLGIRTELLTGRLTGAQKKSALQRLRSGTSHMAIGTHALIHGAVDFAGLGLAIVDEQHKFGVLQRAEIKKKGVSPDILVMTATPIPRTLGLTVYGDLDVSIIDELPSGRKPVKTLVLGEHQRRKAYDIARGVLEKNNQAFIVYPLVEESEKLDLMDATRMAAHLQQDIFPDYRLGLVHGKMSPREKDAVMRRFQAGELSLLVATTVVEVGIDIPQASLMIIEHAERFGLSQLHQLRGRVGRSATQSMCILLAQYKRSDDARRRLSVMTQTNDGFRIAEEDFNIRGPGEFLGTRQSGMPDFRVAHVSRDVQVLVQARKAAFSLVEKDPGLNLPENRLLRDALLERWKGKLSFAGIG